MTLSPADARLIRIHLQDKICGIEQLGGMLVLGIESDGTFQISAGKRVIRLVEGSDARAGKGGSITRLDLRDVAKFFERTGRVAGFKKHLSNLGQQLRIAREIDGKGDQFALCLLR